MGIYTNYTRVASLLEAGNDYNRKTDLNQFIELAEMLVGDCIAYGLEYSIPAMDSTRLSKLATWLSAHLYQQSDKGYTKRKTGSREGFFQIEVGKGLDSTLYGQTAKLIDTSGYLASLDKAGDQEIGMVWLGKRPSEQIDIRNRL